MRNYDYVYLCACYTCLSAVVKLGLTRLSFAGGHAYSSRCGDEPEASSSLHQEGVSHRDDSLSLLYNLYCNHHATRLSSYQSGLTRGLGLTRHVQMRNYDYVYLCACYTCRSAVVKLGLTRWSFAGGHAYSSRRCNEPESSPSLHQEEVSHRDDYVSLL